MGGSKFKKKKLAHHFFGLGVININLKKYDLTFVMRLPLCYKL